MGECSVCVWASGLERTGPGGPFPGRTHRAETELGRRLPGRDRRTSSWTLDEARTPLHSLPALDPRLLPLPVLGPIQLIYKRLVCAHSVAQSCRTLCELTRLLCPWGCFRQEDWSGFPSPPLGIFPTQGSNPCLLRWQVDSLPLGHPGNPASISPHHTCPFSKISSISPTSDSSSAEEEREKEE